MRLFPKSSYNSFLLPFFGVFASTRGYTILVLVAAQYLSARYILAPQKTWIAHLTDLNLLLLVFASSFAIAGGYLINNFYDAEKDRINRPQQYLLHQLIPPDRQLFFYAFFCMNISTYIRVRDFGSLGVPGARIRTLRVPAVRGPASRVPLPVCRRCSERRSRTSRATIAS